MADRRKRDKEKTIQDILVAAKRLFSERGLNGTSIRNIENASGVSKGLILHHFGTKEKLYAAVQDLLAQEYVAAMASHRQDSEDLKEMIGMTVRNSFLYVKENREYRQVSLWSYLEGQERTTELEKRFTTTLIAMMRAGQQSGLIRGDIDAFLMPFILKGTIDYWIRREKLIQELIANDNEQGEDSDQCLMDALAKLFLK